jgi:hypothetical protein
MLSKPAIRRSGVSAERRKPLEIELSGFRPGVFIGYSPEGFLPKAATPFLQEAHHSSFTIHRLNPHYLFDPFSPGVGVSINLSV